MSHTLECLARAYAELGDWDRTLTTTDRGLELTIATRASCRSPGGSAGVVPTRSTSLGRGDEAAAERAQAGNEFDTLTGRIADSDLRRMVRSSTARGPLARAPIRSHELRGPEMDAQTVLREGSPDEVGMDPKRVQRARDLLHAHVDGGNTPTLVALVARRGVIVLAEARRPARTWSRARRARRSVQRHVGDEADYRIAGDDARRGRPARHQPPGLRLSARALCGRQRNVARAPPAHPHLGIRRRRRHGADGQAVVERRADTGSRGRASARTRSCSRWPGTRRDRRTSGAR